jgi:uncharacterized protein
VILIDTGPLVALCDPSDRLHKVARRHLSRLNDVFGTCDAVVAEACVHLPQRAQRERLRAVLERFDIASLPADQDDGQFRQQVFAWLLKYADHEPDWADACVSVLCGRDRTLDVWTYDAEFRTVWRRPDGSRIPIAV